MKFLCAFAPLREINADFKTENRPMRAWKPIPSVVIVILLAVAAIGCGSSSKSGGGGTSMDAMAAQLDAQNAARKKQEEAAAAKAAAEQQAAAAQAAQTPVEPEKKSAGRGKVQFGGYFGAIAGARRHIMNQSESWAWKQAVSHFKATEGRKPKDHDEFMNKIVIPLGIDLGFKEEDEEFLYDPNGESDGDFGQLYVVKKETPPADASSPAAAPVQK
jgi:hypothetical protein